MTSLATIVPALAATYAVPLAHVQAVIEIESGGQAFTTVHDKFGQAVLFPLCRFEGHLFYRFLSGAKRDAAVAAGLASPKIEKKGGVKNPRSQQGRYDLWQRACAIDPVAATAACSWGVGQVLGSHYKAFGLASSLDIYRIAGTLEGQLQLIFDYVKAFGYLDELQRGDWTAFARGYNGPAYRTNLYDEKLAAAAKRHGGAVVANNGMLRMGSKGARVRELQKLLVRAGYSVKVDGDFGPTTKAAAQAFQAAAGVKVDGIVGPETFGKLQSLYQGETENLTKVDAAELPGANKVAGTVVGAVTIQSAKEQIQAAGEAVGGFAGELTDIPQVAGYVEMAASGLVALAGIVGVVALAYGLWQFMKARKTYEGVEARGVA